MTRVGWQFATSGKRSVHMHASLSRGSFGIDFNVPLGAGGFVISDQIAIELDVQLHPAAVVAS